VRQVRETFHTEMHALEVNGTRHIANMSDPRIPAELAGVVHGVVALHDFRPHANFHPHSRRARGGAARPEYSTGLGYAVVPSDLWTIYNFLPAFREGVTGKGQTVVVIEDTDVFNVGDWATFRSTFGLSAYTEGSFTQVHPAPASGSNNCSPPGVVTPDESEATLDAEWASAAAPDAAIVLASCANGTTTDGLLVAIQNTLEREPVAPIISVSYGQCETINGSTSNMAYFAAYQQAVAEGVSVFVSAGDQLAGACDFATPVTYGITVSGLASTPYNVAVGGTDFADTYLNSAGTYWNATNDANYGSALSYIPEIPWNDTCASTLVASNAGYATAYGPTGYCSNLGGSPSNTPLLQNWGGSGGPSACATGTPATAGVVGGTCQGWPKPAWQKVLGNPADGVRDMPDVSLFASGGTAWGHYYVFCDSDLADHGATCVGNPPSAWSGAGGTSFASPILAGVQALVNQHMGARQGNPNPAYYALANKEFGGAGSTSCNASLGAAAGASCVFYDVTLGDIDAPCTGSVDCYLAGGSIGVLSLSTSAYQPAYPTTTGWDFATGLGTVNVSNLVKAYSQSRALLAARHRRSAP